MNDAFGRARARVSELAQRGVQRRRKGVDFAVRYRRADRAGVEHFSVASVNNGAREQILRVLRPNEPVASVEHNFLYVLPVQPRLQDFYGDGLDVLRVLGVHNRYNVTIVAPSFPIDPWYADNPEVPDAQHETFITAELYPWVAANLATTGNEKHWLLGFSKSGLGAQGLLLKHPDEFAFAASWDFPASISSYDEYGPSSAASYGTDANFQATYRLTREFIAARKAPFLATNRIWIGGYNTFGADVASYDALLNSEGVAHLTGEPRLAPSHRWDADWVKEAVAGLSRMNAEQS